MFAKDGYSTIAVAVVISALLSATGYWVGGHVAHVLYVLAAIFLAFILYFFRDPHRDVVDDPSVMISPADGKVIYIRDVVEEHYLKGPAKQLSIFLSPMDVHVNRIPMTGTVEYAKYYPGQYLVAWHEKASDLNERSEFGVKHPAGMKILFKQITGYLARRITFHIKEGDKVDAGYKFGMMKFGSRMDILVPPDFEFEVIEGQRVWGGLTVLGKVVKHESA